MEQAANIPVFKKATVPRLAIFLLFFIWFVRLLALRPLLTTPALGDSEDDCGEADGM
jgi:hypothetical protein